MNASTNNDFLGQILYPVISVLCIAILSYVFLVPMSNATVEDYNYLHSLAVVGAVIVAGLAHISYTKNNKWYMKLLFFLMFLAICYLTSLYYTFVASILLFIGYVFLLDLSFVSLLGSTTKTKKMTHIMVLGGMFFFHWGCFSVSLSDTEIKHMSKLVDFNNAKFTKVTFKMEKFSKNIVNGIIDECNFSTCSHIHNCSFDNTVFTSNINKTDSTPEKNFIRVEDCIFKNTKFYKKDSLTFPIKNTNLSNTIFVKCHFEGAKFNYTILENAYFDSCTFDKETDFSRSNVLNVEFCNPTGLDSMELRKKLTRAIDYESVKIEYIE